ncbi:MAG: GNAT family N-acetyltransferase [Actinomycetota bacterium]
MQDHTRTVRVARREDWRRLRELRLAALLDSPDAFGMTYEESVAAHDESWQWWISGAGSGTPVITFIAEQRSELIGMATGAEDADDPNTAHLFGMFVRPEARGEGVGASLSEAVIEWARAEGFERIVLRVSDGNETARNMYERLSFEDVDGDTSPLREGSTVATRGMTLLLRP